MKRVAILFPGQGSQYVGMGRKLHEADAGTRALFAQASEAAGVDLAHLCFEGPADELARTENTQPALLACSIALYRHWRERTGIAPACVAGHSLGELTALVAAEALSFEDGVRLARRRGLAMSRCSAPGVAGMAAVTQLDRARIEQACAQVPGWGRDFVLANHNAAAQCVLSGKMEALAAAGDVLKKAGAQVIPLKVSGPFHSPFMAGAAAELQAALDSIQLARPRIPVIANVDARPHGEARDVAAALVRQLTSEVRWADTMAWLRAEGMDVVVEAGPKGVLKRLAQANLPGLPAYAVDEEDDQAGLESEFAAELRAMREQPSLVAKCMAVAVCTRNNNWDDEAYQQGVVESYRALQALQEKLESERRAAQPIEMVTALDLLARIFATKQTPHEEREWRLQQILATTGAAAVLPDYVPQVA